MTTQTAIRTGSFINTLGVNTHIDFAAYGYQNLTVVANSVKYLGLTNLRDSAQTASDATTWQQVAQATGAKFDDYIAEASPAGMTTDLGFVTQLAHLGRAQLSRRRQRGRRRLSGVPRQHATDHRTVPAAGLCDRSRARPAGHQHELRRRLDGSEQLAGRLRCCRRSVRRRRLRQCAYLSQCRAGHRLVGPTAQRPCAPGRGVAPGDHHRDRLGREPGFRAGRRREIRSRRDDGRHEERRREDVFLRAVR